VKRRAKPTLPHTPSSCIYRQAYLLLCLQTAFLPIYKTKFPALLYPFVVTPQKLSKGRERKVKEKCK